MAVASRLDSVGNFTVANTGILDEISSSDPNQYSVYSTSSNNSYLSISSASVPATGPFTIEAWIYTTVSATQTIYSQYLQSGDANRWHFSIDNNTGYKLSFSHGTAATAWGSTVVPLNQWNHVAVTRDSSNNLRFFLNGVLDGTTASYTATLSQNAPRISGFLNTGVSQYNFQGYISNFRIVSGTAVYTNSFIPSKAPLTAIPSTVLLTCQSSTFIDNSSSAKTITNAGLVTTYLPPQSDFYAASFNGSSQYISIPNAAGVASYASDFTVEFWMYPTALVSGTYGLAGQYRLSNGRSWLITVGSNGYIQVSNGTTASGSYVGAAVVGAWTHVAWVRSGSIWYLYINGIQQSSPASNGTPAASTENIIIGANGDAASPTWFFPGYISNFRIVKGTALYTGAFKPDINFTPVSGTSVLTLQNSSLVDNSTNIYTITNSTSVTSSLIRSPNFLTTASQQSFDGNHKVGGIYDEVTITPSNQYATSFSGSSQYISVPSGPFVIGTSNFTAECWINSNNLASNPVFIDNWALASGNLTGQWQLTANATTITFWYGTGTNTQSSVSGSFAFSANTWYHVAAVREGTGTNQFKIYVNGNVVATGTISASLGVSVAGSIGRQTSNQFFMGGYISNVRVVIGTAVYTRNFIPPVAPLAAVPGTTLLTCQNATTVDNSFYAYSLTNNSTTVYNPPYPTFYATSFSGSGQYLDTPSSATLTLGTGDFTIESWVYWKGGANRIVGGSGTNDTVFNVVMDVANDGSFNFGGWTTGTKSTLKITQNTWNHFAWTRVGTTERFFVNGVLSDTVTRSFNFSATTSVGIGHITNTNGLWNGYISNLRIVKGLSLYNSAFTPSQTNLTAVTGTVLLTCQNATIIDNSTNAFTITNTGTVTVLPAAPFTSVRQQYSSGDYLVSGVFDEVTAINESYSASFNGSSQYLSFTGTSSVQLSGSPFTVECWINLTGYSAGYGPSSNVYAGALFWNDYAGGGNGFELVLAGTSSSWTSIYFYSKSSGAQTNNILKSYAFSLNTWYHVAVVSNGSTLTFYVNGTSIGSGAITTWTDTTTYAIGGGGNSPYGYYFPGYMSNFRVVKGIAVYTGNFNPPQSHLTAVPGTSLLTCQSSTLVDNSTNAFTITNNGSVTTYKPPYSPFYAASFNGSSQYLRVASNAAFSMGTGDFTFEFWIYPTSFATASFPLDLRGGVTLNPAPLFYMDTTGAMVLGIPNGATTAYPASVPSLTLNAWNHVAWVRASGFTSAYLNGVYSNGSADTNTYGQYGVSIGATGGSAVNLFPGYISNLRIVKGVAVYTSAFTPPTSQLTAISGTSLLTCQSSTLIDNSTNGFTITNTGSVSTVPREPF